MAYKASIFHVIMEYSIFYDAWKSMVYDKQIFCSFASMSLERMPAHERLVWAKRVKAKGVTGIRKANSKTNIICVHNHRRHAYEKTATPWLHEITALGRIIFLWTSYWHCSLKKLRNRFTPPPSCFTPSRRFPGTSDTSKNSPFFVFSVRIKLSLP